MSASPHYLVPPQRWPLSVLLIGCGGNGAQILTGLASLHLALEALGERGLDVTTVDPDIVSTANLGRQPFYPCDVGRHKALVLTERINMAYGIAWQASPTRVGATSALDCDLIISCVDTAAARRAIGAALSRRRHQTPTYWLDLGNRADDGQIVLGQVANSYQALKQPRLPTVLERFPELADETRAEDDTPSCSLAEALERQSLFVNRTIAAHALGMLYQLVARGSIGYAGTFINLANGLAAPMPLPVPPPRKPRARPKAKPKTRARAPRR